MTNESNPYSPPSSKVTDPPPEPGSPVKAVTWGVLTDLGGTIVSSIVIGIIYSAVASSSARSPDELAALMQSFGKDGWSYLLLTLVGSGFSILGGYVCARISQRTDYRLGFVTGAISVAFGLLMAWDQAEALMHVLMAVVTIICVLAGMKLGMPRAHAPKNQ
jgi:uncharacterized membrane protein YdjX (TVP38/TMEM64 family)